jgi:ABC-type dipeptide/oligopeptide/nickel transport system ATPase component
VSNSMKRMIALLGASGSGKSTVTDIIAQEYGSRAHTVAFAFAIKDFAANVFGFTNEQLWGPSELRNVIDDRFSGEARLITFNQIDRRFKKYAPVWLLNNLPTDLSYSNAFDALKKWYATVKTHDAITPRFVLQTLGTEFGRNVHPDIWIMSTIAKTKKVLQTGYAIQPFRAIYKCDIVTASDLRFVNEAQAWINAGGEIWLITRPNMSDIDKAGVVNHASEQDYKNPEMQKYVSRHLLNDGDLNYLKKAVLAALNDGSAVTFTE